jgi:hypothetical protein
MMGFVLISVLLSMGYAVLTDFAWRPRIVIRPLRYLKQVQPNLAYIGHDRGATKDSVLKDKFQNVQTWVCINGNGGTPAIINSKADFFISTWNVPRNPVKFTKEYLVQHNEMNAYAIEGRFFDINLFNNYEKFGLVITECEKIKLNIIDANEYCLFFHIFTSETAERLGYTPLTFEDVMNTSYLADKYR